MLARVTSIQAEATDEVLAFRHAVLRQAQALGGFRGALDLVDRESGRAIAVTLWEDEASLRASERATRPGGAGGPRVEIYEARWYPAPEGTACGALLSSAGSARAASAPVTTPIDVSDPRS